MGLRIPGVEPGKEPTTPPAPELSSGGTVLPSSQPEDGEFFPAPEDDRVSTVVPLDNGGHIKVSVGLPAEFQPKPGPEPTAKEEDPKVTEGGAEDGSASDPGQAYERHVNEMTADTSVSEADALFGKRGAPAGGTAGTGTGMATAAPAAATTAEAKKAPVGRGVGLDILHGIGESPSAVLGGVRDATQNAMDGVAAAGDYLTKKLPDFLRGGLVGDKDGIRLLGKEEYDKFREKAGTKGKSGIGFPEVGQPDTVTGGIVRGVSQFLTGFIAAGRVGQAAGLIAKGAEATAAASTTAKIVTPMAKGVIADFAVFAGHEKNLANLLEEHAGLKNPVLDFLATDPNNSEGENRLKTALTGLITGVGAELAIKGMVVTLKSMRAGRIAKALAYAKDKVFGEHAGEVLPREISPGELHPLGDPEGPLMRKAAAKVRVGDQAAANGVTAKEVVEAGEEAMTGADVNFGAINGADDIKKVIGLLAKKWSKQMKDAGRGVISHAKTVLNAEQENAFELLVSRRKGQAMNAEETVAIRELWAAAAAKLKDMALLAERMPSDANHFNFRKMQAIYYAIQKEAMGARAEAGRALDAWKIKVGGSSDMLAQVTEALEGAGGEKNTRELVKKIASLARADKDMAMSKFVEGSLYAKTRDAIAQAWTNGLLWRPASHAKNFIANLAFAYQQILERRTAEYITKTFGTQAGVEAGEAAAMHYAMTTSMREAFVLMAQKAKQAIRNPGQMVDDARAFLKQSDAQAIGGIKQEGRAGALSAERWGVAKDTTLGRALDFLEVTTRSNFRLLGATDDVFKGMASRMELHAQSVRAAAAELRGGKITKDAFAARVAELAANPTMEMKQAIDAQAAYQTFTNKPNAMLKKGADWFQSIPVAGRLFLPFKNTPINEFVATLERSPMAPFLSSFRADVKAGGARADIAYARMATGMATMGVMTDLALSSKMTGKGPTEPAERAHWLLDHQPYSVKIGGKWIAYNALGAMGSAMAMAADYGEAVKRADETVPNAQFNKALVTAAFSLAGSVTSKSYMQGMANLFEAITNADQKAYTVWLQEFGSIGVPGFGALGGAVAQQMDPIQRVAENEIDAIWQKVPGLSKTLAARKDFWGRDIKSGSDVGAGYDLFSPFKVKDDTQEPIEKEFIKLRFYPRNVDDKLHFGSIELRLNAHQKARYAELAGNGAKDPNTGLGCLDQLNAMAQGDGDDSDMYEFAKEQDAEDGGERAKNMIQHAINQARKRAREQLMSEDKNLQAQYDQKKNDPEAIPAAEQFEGVD